MKKRLLLLAGLAGCTPKHTLMSTAHIDVLPIRQGKVAYFSPLRRLTLSSTAADTWMQQWADSYSAIFDLQPLAPLVDKKGILYSGKLPARRIYDESGGRINFPALSFNVVVNNSTDSTKIWVTDLAVRGQQGWLPIEQHRFDADKKYLALWLTGVDATINELVISIEERLGIQHSLRN